VKKNDICGKINMMLRDKISALFWLTLRLGPVRGVLLFLKIQLKLTAKINFPGIRYPFRLRPDTSDIPTFYQVFLYREYDINFGNPEVIIDGGANIGLFAILMKNKFPEARIICVEPDPENFELLKENLQYYDGIHVEQQGIWDKETRLFIHDKFNEGKWGMVVEESVELGTINAISISGIMDKYGFDQIDLVKLDIETSEKQVFSANFMSWLPKVNMLIVELHDKLEPGCSRAFFQAINQCFMKYAFSMKGENVIVEQQPALTIQ
jgi:FkbM family methyltransferase